MDDLIRIGLEAYGELWFTWLLVATGIVVAGLLFEAPEIWHETAQAIRGVLLSFEPERHSPAWVKLAGTVGWLLIVVGVGGEFVAERFVSRADGMVRQFDEIVLADTQKKSLYAFERAAAAYSRAAQTEREAAKSLEASETARKEAEGFNLKIAQANERASKNEKEAAQLRKDAEGERLARVNIEAAVAFRSLDDKQKRDIGITVARFSNLVGAVMSYEGGSVEAESFANDIAEALRSVHIRTTVPGGLITMRESGEWDGALEKPDAGVGISSAQNAVAHSFADLLVKELTGLGFDCKRNPDQPLKDGSPPPQVVWITVGLRPIGPQGEYKLAAQRDATAKNLPGSKR